MKRLLFLAIVAMAAVSCGPKNETQKEEAPKAETPKVLVLYYSQTSNTKAVATEIATRLGADIEEIVLTKPYDEDFQATIARCKNKALLPRFNRWQPTSPNTMWCSSAIPCGSVHTRRP